eukprot:2245187-Amphidinium_carterae.1
MFQDQLYDAMQNLLDDEETMDLTEYLQTKQYLHYRIYQQTTIHLQKRREDTSTTSPKRSITTVEYYNTP